MVFNDKLVRAFARLSDLFSRSENKGVVYAPKKAQPNFTPFTAVSVLLLIGMSLGFLTLGVSIAGIICGRPCNLKSPLMISCFVVFAASLVLVGLSFFFIALIISRVRKELQKTTCLTANEEKKLVGNAKNPSHPFPWSSEDDKLSVAVDKSVAKSANITEVDLTVVRRNVTEFVSDNIFPKEKAHLYKGYSVSMKLLRQEESSSNKRALIDIVFDPIER